MKSARLGLAFAIGAALGVTAYGQAPAPAAPAAVVRQTATSTYKEV